MKLSNLTVLSFGGGQDSAVILQWFIKDFQGFRARYAPGKLIAIMSDAGDEHDHTYKYVAEVETVCAKHGIPFFFLKKEMGYHVQSWQGLMEAQHRSIKNGKAMIVQLNTKSCTDQLKLGPIYKFLDGWINDEYEYGFKPHSGGGVRKEAIKKFVNENGLIRVLIGFAAGEESRRDKSLVQQAKDQAKSVDENWKAGIYREFPLIDLRYDRKACQEYLKSIKETVPYPSNCMRCPYMSKQEMLWLYRNHPAKWEEWC
jgi:3'-phosphoadenosine 5'-phosphosulfate sulfotransferase (PAPS reductase)/FAD synthetase